MRRKKKKGCHQLRLRIYHPKAKKKKLVLYMKAVAYPGFFFGEGGFNKFS
jgi:hypothetical protein